MVRCVYLFDCGCHHLTFILPLKERTMADYPINRGIGKPVEFKGLKSQYLFIFAGGLLALFVLFIIMYMVGINQWVCIIFGVTSATLLVWQTFRLNEKYGTYGLMKLSARRSHPFHIINRKAISSSPEPWLWPCLISSFGVQVPLGGPGGHRHHHQGGCRGCRG